ncbi:hypothetical protein C9F11_37920 [Streptomyces sp. YIM 121038]|uniref:hypothetical protein n=1 Tax=Streptomyces sp. YIM 121038 TaxID=2136401 RepID=UPI001110FA90|nr:hypothetical protein [Streptomyces sp. YIM 121038]QCX81167.1 hypothetical protein C9F11_37920 [Streptomyces sp. YIM 121038]
MTAIVPEPNLLADLPSMPAGADPVLLPRLLRGLGLTDYQRSINDGLVESFEEYCSRISAKEATP